MGWGVQVLYCCSTQFIPHGLGSTVVVLLLTAHDVCTRACSHFTTVFGHTAAPCGPLRKGWFSLVSAVMPGRLKSHINIWRRTTNDPLVLSVIQHGYRIQWKDSIPPPPSEQKNSKNCFNHTDFITKSVDEALLLGVVQETSKEHIHNVLPLNVNVKKNNGKLRLIFNAMFINQFMVVPTFKYPQLHKEGREIFGNSLWACSFDV